MKQFAATLAAALTLACGESAPEPAGRPASPLIVQAPADVAVFQGQTAFFQVRASGSSLAYQWSRDGVAIPGATDSHYTTPSTAPADDGAAYQVAVTAGGSAPVMSSVVRVTVLPPLDLRFQWVGAPILPGYVGPQDLLIGHTLTFQAVGGPLLVGDGICAPPPPVANCAWGISGVSPVHGFQTRFQASVLGDFGAGWVYALPPNALVTSLDVEEGAGAFAAAALETTQTGTFTPHFGLVALDQLPSTAADEGAQGRVLTAVSFQGGLVTYVSYAWSETPAAQYEAHVVATTVAGAGAAATDLAAQGYVITAFGAGDLGANGVVLVGTRQAGDTAPRMIQVEPVGGAQLLSPPGYAIVGYVFDLSAVEWTAIFER